MKVMVPNNKNVFPSRAKDARAGRPHATLWQVVRCWITHKPLSKNQKRWELMKQEFGKQAGGQ
jgi:hypothetical protein